MNEQQASSQPAPHGGVPVLAGQHVVLGAGPVGRSVAEVAAGAGADVTVLTRSGTNVAGAATQAVDIADVDALATAIAGAGVVYQCAQPAYHRWTQEFPALQSAVVEACARVSARLVVVENLYGYGAVDGPLHRELPLVATTRKGRVRAEMWRSLEAAHAAGRIDVLAVRGSDFIGPGVTASVFGERFVDRIVAGKAADVFGATSVLHTVTYVPDLARAMVVLGADDDAYGSAWHAPNEPAITVGRLVELLAATAGTEPQTRRVQSWQLRLGGLFVPAAREMIELQYEFDRDFVVDDAATRERFGVASTPLDVVAARTVEWYRNRA